jgi:tRNA threonylcarbamoyladenosine biosynthesis protein TsaB
MSPGPVLLAFDTSTEQLSVVLLHRGSCLTVDEAGGAAASANLLPRVHGLLAQAGLHLSALDAVAFGQGPGAFTGLRTSCAVAQGLGFGLGCDLLPIDSLLIVAEDARVVAGRADREPFVVDVAMDARIEEAYAARYVYGPAGWQTLLPPALLSLPALAQRAEAVDAPGYRAGSAWMAYAERLPPPRLPLLLSGGRAAALGRLALAAWSAGGAIDPALALPVYLRDKVALTTQERLAARQPPAAGSEP